MQKILIVRRDNIGDLVCTTPLIRALRQRYPDARIDALVTSYNRGVLSDLPELSHVYAYTKGKHREPGQSLVRLHYQKLVTLWTLRRVHYDVAIAAQGTVSRRALALARNVGANRLISLVDGTTRMTGVTDPVTARQTGHEVERVFALGQPLGIQGPPGACRVVADEARREILQRRLDAVLPDGPRFGIQLSARKPSQRWPVLHYAHLIEQMQRHWPNARFLVFWAPGAENDPRHPGDDRKAAELMQHLARQRVLPIATSCLEDLIAGIDLCDAFLTPDGGAMHLAAGLGKPVLALFGDSDPEQWQPWGVPRQVLQPASRQVADLQPGEVMAAWCRLLDPLPQ